MSAHTVTLSWKRGDQPFSDGKYSRGHDIAFDAGFSIVGSSSPQVVRPPLSREDAVDPEELMVASLSSCHMLFFLDFARRAGFVIDSYVDRAEGDLGKGGDGKMQMTQVRLNPRIDWAGDRRPTEGEVAELHHKSHDACFIANSFKGEVVVAANSTDRLELQTELERKIAMRARLDQRVRQESSEEPDAAEDPIALADLEGDIDRLRQQISVLDVEIAELERELSALP